jgi:hypothetical protein
MAAIPEAPKHQNCSSEISYFSSSNQIARATWEPLAGIIDCAFENRDKELIDAESDPV